MNAKITAEKTWENGYKETREFLESDFDEMIQWFMEDPEAGIFTSCEDYEKDQEIFRRVQQEFNQ